MSKAKRPLKVLYTTAEVAPFSKVGGLADVAAALPKALARRGHQTMVIAPSHGGDAKLPHPETLPVTRFHLSVLGQEEEVTLRQACLEPEVWVLLVENSHYFGRALIYGEPNDLERYHFFCRAVLETPKQLSWVPDILHTNDWHTAPINFGLRNLARVDPFYQGAASVLTIHNLGYRGPDPLTDFLSQGIYYADAINTVSPTYAREILTPEYGEGLESLLQHRQERLFGILNGIDYEEYNPATDPHLVSNFGATTLEERSPNKARLQETVGLAPDPQTMVVGMVSRLTAQKGFDLLREAIGSILSEEQVQLVLLGTGERHFEELFTGLAHTYPQQVAVRLEFNEPLARLIYGGCDLFLMPSRYEPCGLGQMIAMRYGAIPLVRRTGGLADTVVDYDPRKETGNGFVFVDYQPQALVKGVQRAWKAFQGRRDWRHLMGRAMAADFSWEAPAQKYEELYYRALAFKEQG